MSKGLPLRVSHLSKDFGRGPVLADLSFELSAGETLAVIGPSGCGKSTLLALLAGLDKPSAGTALCGEGSAAGRVAFILQDYGLFPWKTAEKNLALPLELRGEPAPEKRRRCADMLKELNLTGLGKRFPSQLSGGQRQRVAIGRALITEPDVLLMDEPFSSLDALTREHLQNTVLDLWRSRRPTCVLVTHSVAEAVFLGMRIMVLNGHPARKVLWLENPCFGNSDSPLKDGVTRQIYAALGGEAMGPDETPASAEDDQ